MSLTDDWKAGKLEEGWYYVRNAFLGNGAVGKLESKDNCLYCPHSYVFTHNGDTKILSPVPSYGEYLESEAHCSVYSEKNAELIETNDSLSRQVKHLLDLQANQDKEVENLKKLVRKCRTFIELSDCKIITNKENYTKDLLTRINAAIGESEEKCEQK